jgi:hypothetical protein
MSSEEALLLELFKRQQAKLSLADYISYCELGFAPVAHHRLLISHLEAVARRECSRLMVCMPPGYAKSTYTSATFPAWYLGLNPTHFVIATTRAPAGDRSPNAGGIVLASSLGFPTPGRLAIGRDAYIGGAVDAKPPSAGAV